MKIISAKLGFDPITNSVVSVTLLKEDGRYYGVPFAEGNSDYEAYLKWVAEGNTPSPADAQG